jgi:hypothetical protein
MLILMLYDFNSINHPNLMGARRSCGQLSRMDRRCGIKPRIQAQVLRKVEALIAPEREGRGRVVSMWNKEGLAFYYTVEKNWKEIYNGKAKFSVLFNGCETWEPKDKNKKDAIKTYWSVEGEKMSSEKNVPQEKDWWEQEDEGYDTDSKVNTECLW